MWLNPFTAIGPENFRAYLRTYLNSQITSDFFIQRALSKADSMQFNLLVASLYKNVVFYEKKNTQVLSTVDHYIVYIR